MYNTIAELIEQAGAHGVQLWEIVLDNECALTGCTRERVFARLEQRMQVMQDAACKALEAPLPTVSGLIEGVASTHHTYTQTAQGGICGLLINRAMSLALSCSETNASMGKICAAPTAGACGILPAVLLSLGEAKNLPRQTLLQGLLTASGIGAVITKNATVSGAQGGCQAECGVAAAMAAAAAVEMLGGAPQTAADAAAFSLINAMGLVCDPVAGLVQIPCAQRNASQTVNALLSADLAMAGMKSVIPPDQVVDAMARVGNLLPRALKETAGGGIAATPAGRALFREIFGTKED